MEIQFFFDAGEPVFFDKGIPESYKGKILCDGSFFSSVTGVGTLLVQEYSTALYTLRYNIFKFFKKITVTTQCSRPGFHVRVMLKGGLTHRVNTLGKLHVNVGKYVMLYAESGECITQFDREKEYHTFDIYFSRAFIEPFLLHFTNLSPVLQIQDIPAAWITPAGKIANQKILDIIDSVLSAPFNKATNYLFNDEKTHDLLTAVLEQLQQKPSKHLRFSDAEIEILHKTKKYIEDNHHLHTTIRQIAKECGINEFKLKSGFRIYFGMGLFDCLLQARMKRALEMVLERERPPMKQISSMVGYKRLPAFSDAFKKYYGKAPGKMRYNK